MQLVSTSFVAALAAAMLICLGPRRGLWAAFAVMPLGAAAAFNLPALGGASIVLADAAALTLFAVTLASRGAIVDIYCTIRPMRPGFILVVLFLYATFATIFFPRMFAGQTEVFGIARVEEVTQIVLIPLQPTTGNITQLFRLALGVLIFVALAAAFRREPDPQPVVFALVASTLVHCAFGGLDVLTYSLGLESFLDPIRTANYAMASNQVMAGLKRMVGGFPEASAFGYHTMALFGFWLSYWFDKGRFRHAGWCLLASTAVLILSTSTAAYVASVLFFALFGLVNARQLLTREIGRRLAIIIGGTFAILPVVIAGLIVAYQVSPGVTAYFDRMLFTKLESDSGVERMSWNVQALQNFADSWMIGIGVGSVRASNWLVATLASLGLLGTAMFGAFIVSVLRIAPPERREEAIVFRALKMGCLALLTRAMITKATPNLELIFLAMAGLAVGLSQAATARWRQGHAPSPSARSEVGYSIPFDSHRHRGP